MKLSTVESENFYEALLSGYPSYDKLRIMVQFKLGENLDRLSTGSGLETVVLDLIQWAEERNKILDLILGAYEKNPDNTEIKENTCQLLSRIIDPVRDDLKERFSKVVNQLDIVKSKPQNQLPEDFDFAEHICYIDFAEAIKTFTLIKSQFNEGGGTVLFLMEEKLIRRGDLYLKRLKDELKPKRGHFREFNATYSSGKNREVVVQKIGEYLNIKQGKMTITEYITLVIQNLSDSLQNNSVFFIQIECDISEQSEIDPLIPWFIEYFWQPLRIKIQEITQRFACINVIAVITCNLEINQRLSCYLNEGYNVFEPDKLVKIPLQDSWTKEDIYKWLAIGKIENKERDTLSTKFYNQTQGRPRDVCYVLGEWIEPISKMSLKP
jgi:hypothetical protein